jgi:hypothetical protein
MDMRTRLLHGVVIVLAARGLVGAAETPPATARALLDRRQELENTTRRWTDRYQHIGMEIVDADGEVQTRELAMYDKRYGGDERKTIVFFLADADVKGTALLGNAHGNQPSSQWLYLPELKKIRQIGERDRDDSFMDTDLSYRDLDVIQQLGSWPESDAPSRLVREETIDGVRCQLIELLPRREDIGYRRILVWLDPDDLVPRRLEFYDGEGQPKRRISQREVRTVGAVPVAHRVETETPAAKTKTITVLKEARFDQGLADRLFTQRCLEIGPGCVAQ